MEAIIYIHIYENDINFMVWKGNKGWGSFKTLEEARNSFESKYDQMNCKVIPMVHEFDYND